MNAQVNIGFESQLIEFEENDFKFRDPAVDKKRDSNDLTIE